MASDGMFVKRKLVQLVALEIRAKTCSSSVHVPELDTELVVEAEWEWSMAGDVDVDELVLVPSSVVFLKKLCCSA